MTGHSQNSLGDNDPNDYDMADVSNDEDAQLAKEYEIVDASEFRSSPTNAPKPPQPIDLLAQDRTYQYKLAERQGFWLNDPAYTLRGGKQRTKAKDDRSDEQKASEADAERRAWECAIKDDIRKLWDSVVFEGVLQDRTAKKAKFFRDCRDALEGIEKMGEGVGMAVFQETIAEVMREYGVKLETEKLKVLKELATEKGKMTG